MKRKKSNAPRGFTAAIVEQALRKSNGNVRQAATSLAADAATVRYWQQRMKTPQTTAAPKRLVDLTKVFEATKTIEATYQVVVNAEAERALAQAISGKFKTIGAFHTHVIATAASLYWTTDAKLALFVLAAHGIVARGKSVADAASNLFRVKLMESVHGKLRVVGFQNIDDLFAQRIL
jgi:hypothetical protein